MSLVFSSLSCRSSRTSGTPMPLLPVVERCFAHTHPAADAHRLLSTLELFQSVNDLPGTAAALLHFPPSPYFPVIRKSPISQHASFQVQRQASFIQFLGVSPGRAHYLIVPEFASNAVATIREAFQQPDIA